MIIKSVSPVLLKNVLIKFILFFILLVLVISNPLSANCEDLDLNFPVQGGTNGTVYATALQRDGKILIAGIFSKVNGVSQQLVARLNPEGNLDKTFQPALNTVTIAVYTIVIQPDGKILLGGAFNRFNNAIENRIVRLNSNGSLDTTFAPVSGANSTVKTIALEPDGRILVGGLFTEFNGKSANRIVRLNTDGSLDQSFVPSSGANGAVESISVDNQGKILIGGAFTNVNGVLRSGIARLNQDGSLDSNFDTGTGTAAGNPGVGSNNVYSIVVQTDDKILIGGDFYFFNGVERRSIIRLNKDGSLDNGFNAGTGIDGNVRHIAILEDDKIIIAGSLNIFIPASRNRIARLNSNGTLDTTFNTTGLNSDIFSFVVQQDGKIVIGGSFNGVNLSLRYRIARLNSDGSLDLPFAPAGGANGSICKIMPQLDGKLLIGGSFTKFNGIPRKGIVRLNEDGTVDYSFDSSNGINEGNYSKICSIIPLADGKIIIGGEFNSYGGVTQRSVARLNQDGSLDTSFIGSLNIGSANKVVKQPDGKIIVGGNFDGVNGNNQPNLARLNEDGSIDTSFIIGTGPNSQLSSVELTPNGKILIAGDFHRYNGIDRDSVARLNADGSLDTTFNAGEVVGSISGLLTQLDGKILVRGYFDSIAGVPYVRFARLNTDGSVDLSFNPGAGPYGLILDFVLQPDGKIIIGGQFSAYNNVTQNKLARINSNGSLDTALVTGIGPNNNVGALWRQPNGTLLIGGSFNAYSGLSTTNLIKLIGRNHPAFDFDGDGRSDISVFRPDSGAWHLQQSQSGYAGVGFGLLTDKLVPADYDGDGKTDIAVFRENPSDPGKAKFFILHSANNQFREEQFGATGDIPVAGDWDGDGKSDIGVYRAGTTVNPQGYFYYRLSSQPGVNFIPYPWGIAGDKPVVSDFDGDGKADPAVFRPSNGAWYIQRSRDGFFAIQFGAAEDKPVVGDYDGDGKADQAVFRPSNGVWYVWNSTTGFSAAQFGVSTDKPVPADYDGDGKTDKAVYRDGNWFLLNSTSGFAALGFGNSTDKPIANSFVP